MTALGFLFILCFCFDPGEKPLKWTTHLSQYLSQLIVKEFKKAELASFHASEEVIAKEIHLLLTEDLDKEKALEQEVQALMDQLEKDPGTANFERYKMYPLLKKKLAEKKGIIL